MNEPHFHASVSNNQQSIVPRRFAELKEKRKKDIENLIKLFTNETALALLPLEMWIHIVSFVLPNDYNAHFIFLRKNICYQDTYYMFIGTETMFHIAMAKLRQEVNEIKLYSRAIEDDALDTPIDTYCNTDHTYCPDENGHHCSCQWQHCVYETAEDYLSAYNYAVEYGTQDAYFRSCEFCFI
jgi:hypothetical protein